MANTSSRTLRLLSLLQTHRYWPGSELADRLGVSVRTLRRDVERLRELGYPVRASRGIDGGYQLAPGAALPPLLLDDEEAVALAVALQTAAHGAVSGVAESSVRALAKVIQVMPRPLRRRVEAVRAATDSGTWATARSEVDADVLVVVAQACRDTERLEFAYRSAGGELTQRSVEPVRMVRLGRRWYLVAYDLGRHDWRSFRLDRLAQLRRTGARFRSRELPATDAVSFVRAGIRTMPTTYRISAVVHASPADIRARIGTWAQVEPAGTGCRVWMNAEALEWPAMALGVLDVEFEQVTPPEFAEYLRGWSARFARAVESGAR